MRKIVLFWLFLLPLLLGAQTVDSLKYSINFEPYIGSRYAATFDNVAGDQWQEPFVIKVGLKSIIRIDTNNKIYAAPWLENYDWLKLRSVLYYEHNTSFWTVRFGPFLTRPIAMYNKPHPLSQYGQIALRSQDLMPDNDLGLNFSLKNIFNLDLIDVGFFEARQDKQRFGEFNFSLNKNWGDSKACFSGYAGPLGSGWAVKLQKENLSLLYYRNYSDLSPLQSALCYWTTGSIGDLYISLIHNWQLNQYESLSFGWLDRTELNIEGGKFYVDYGFGIQSEPVVSINVLLMFSF